MKLKNFCPYKVGDIYITSSFENPANTFLNTTWQKIEGRFLLGTSGSQASKLTGGSNTKTITQTNLPNIKLKIDSFSVSRGTMDITGSFDLGHHLPNATGAFTAQSNRSPEGSNNNTGYKINFKASNNWTGSSTAVTPQTIALGSGTPLDITPSYYTIHVWLRLT